MTETITTDSPDVATAAERYFAFWNADTPEEQHRRGAEAFTEDVEYCALVGVLTGPDAMSGFRNQFIGHMGSAELRPVGDLDAHHDRARLRWEIVLENGDSFAAGTDIIRVAGDGRISEITAFLDRAPEGFDPHAHD